jgi:hypothetical protein
MLTCNVDGVDEDSVRAEELKARPPRAARPFVRNAIAVLCLIVIFFGVLLVRNWRADSDNGPAKAASGARTMPSSPEIEDKYGVRFLGVDVTSGGGMIQVRYQVLDSAKTEAIHTSEATPNVIDGNGVTYNLPGMAGHTHIGPVKKAGVTDFVLLANARGGVKSGSTVTVKIGELELHDVPVS